MVRRVGFAIDTNMSSLKDKSFSLSLISRNSRPYHAFSKPSTKTGPQNKSPAFDSARTAPSDRVEISAVPHCFSARVQRFSRICCPK